MGKHHVVKIAQEQRRVSNRAYHKMENLKIVVSRLAVERKRTAKIVQVKV